MTVPSDYDTSHAGLDVNWHPRSGAGKQIQGIDNWSMTQGVYDTLDTQGAGLTQDSPSEPSLGGEEFSYLLAQEATSYGLDYTDLVNHDDLMKVAPSIFSGIAAQMAYTYFRKPVTRHLTGILKSEVTRLVVQDVAFGLIESLLAVTILLTCTLLLLLPGSPFYGSASLCGMATIISRSPGLWSILPRSGQ